MAPFPPDYRREAEKDRTMSDELITAELVEKALRAGSIMSKGFTRIAMRNALIAVLPALVAGERERAIDAIQRQAYDRRTLQELYARKFGGHSFEQQREGHAALVLEELAAAIRQEPAP